MDICFVIFSSCVDKLDIFFVLSATDISCRVADDLFPRDSVAAVCSIVDTVDKSMYVVLKINSVYHRQK